ncbi:hypothetical protein KVV02_000009 [Mortierella alpina]|uniref:Uncharacterized protein n=1 Tax=Mortierella alpina TaxID=64518 RepID=A0A9P8A9T6_MORAP|nr:hypothetical protein KVV02_000009 [Mortierella alpina]
MLKKDQLKDGNRSAESSIASLSGGKHAAAPLVDKLGALDISSPTSSASAATAAKGSAPSTTTDPAPASSLDDFDLNDMDDPLAGFEAQRSGIKDLSLKEQFLNPTESNVESLQTLLAARIREGSGETLFEIGVEEDGTPMKLNDTEYQTALSTVRTAAAAVGAEVAVMFEKSAGDSTAPSIPDSQDKDTSSILTESSVSPAADADQSLFKSSYVMVRKTPKSVEELLELRVAVVGNVVCVTL